MSHLTLAASEAAVDRLFAVLRDGFTFSSSGSETFANFTASYDMAIRLEEGSVSLLADNTVSIRELDIKWDKMEVCLGFNIPEICAGGWCIVPTPFGCAVRMPKFCVFEGNPDIEVCLPLVGLITSEISGTVRPLIGYLDAGGPRKWQLFLDPDVVDVDVFDIEAIVSDLLLEKVDEQIGNLLSPLPGVVESFVRGVLGSVLDLVRAILDLPDDIGEWLRIDLLGVTFGLLTQIADAIAEYLSTEPLKQFESPFQILDPHTDEDGVTLIPVKIPIAALDARVSADELILEADIGWP